MVSGDLCIKSVPRAEIDHRARDTRLGLERTERMLVPRASSIIPAHPKALSSRLWHRQRKPAA